MNPQPAPAGQDQPTRTRRMRRAIVLPGGTAPQQLELAVLAEQSGWDGVFSFETGYGVDPWSLLAAMAVQTSRVRLGTMLTPLPWRRPWKLASQVATVDQLSGGRVILAVGIGAAGEGLPETGEVTGVKERAERLDEGIDLIRTLWQGGTRYHGQHYQYECATDGLSTAIRPAQERIPVWVVGVWPRPKSMRRVLRCDGIVPQFSLGGRDGAPEDIRALRGWLAEHGARPDLDVIAEGETPAGDPQAAADQVAPWAAAGCTWWMETRWAAPGGTPEGMRTIRDRIAAGPPR
jgi:alkanesulfonate monooxygenase SsuD/methylene tetrahydromethanopterin reductase-like flavin-dependent oxidoreductase (luciferase family)